MAALSRIAINDHRHVKLQEDDTVVLSAAVDSGNEKAIGRVINHLSGAAPSDSRRHQARHVSGHGSEEELKLMLSPCSRATSSRSTANTGSSRSTRESPERSSRAAIRIRRPCSSKTVTSCTLTRTAPALPEDHRRPGFIDGTRTGEVGDEVLRDRRHLAEDGLVVPVVAINKQTGQLEGRTGHHHARLRHGEQSGTARPTARAS